MFNYSMDAKQLSKIYSEKKDEQEKLEVCLREFITGYCKADFDYLSFNEKRELLANKIQSMTFDKTTKEVEIIFGE